MRCLVVDDDETCRKFVIRVMERLSGRSLNPARKPAREGDIRHSLGSPLAAQQLLGFRSDSSIEDGLGAFLA